MTRDVLGNTIADRIRMVRRERKDSQSSFAAKVQSQIKPMREVTNIHISRYECGTCTPPLEMILAMAQAGDVAPGWLAFGDI